MTRTQNNRPSRLPIRPLRHLSIWAAVASSVVGLAMGQGLAQELPEPGDFSLNRFRPAMDRHGIQNVEWGGLTDETFIEVTTFLHYINDPLVLERFEMGDLAPGGPLLHHRVDADVIVTLGLCYVQIAVGTRYTLYQGRPEIDFLGGSSLKALPDGAPSLQSLRERGLGDFFLATKAPILSADRHPIALAALVNISVPGGEDSYLSDTSATFAPGLAASRERGALRLAGNVGAVLRRDTQFLDLDVSKEIFYRLGMGYRFGSAVRQVAPAELDLSLSGAFAASRPFENGNESPVEIIVGGRYNVRSLRVQIFGGSAIGLDNGHGNPDFRVFGGLRHWVAQPGDRDGDGIPNARDGAPREPEDKDGFEDHDGVPDLDNDGDGVLDEDDRAPMEPEDRDGFQDEDGVPDLDNDGDGVPDIRDDEPDQPEDLDGFQDRDGAPDLDNDGDGVPDNVDGAPLRAEDRDGFADDDGIPDPDNDGDGIADIDDAAPDKPEDMDGFADDDGAPDLDNDGDAIADVEDLCPRVAGTEQYRGCPDSDGDGLSDRFDSCPEVPGTQANHGCPRRPAVVITESEIQVAGKIYFRTGKAIIQRRSFGLLDDIASVLRAHPEIAQITIEGHTDNRGSEDINGPLSQARAESVRDYLVTRGVEASRLQARGHGSSQPAASNETARGRAENRRVTFIITTE